MSGHKMMTTTLVVASIFQALAIVGVNAQYYPSSTPSPSPVPAGSSNPNNWPSNSPAPTQGYDRPGRLPPQVIKATYFQSFKDFPPSSIDASYFTHIYYAFLQVDPASLQPVVTPNDAVKMPELIAALKHTPVKTFLSIGGAANDPKIFSRMAGTKEARSVFIKSTIRIARDYGFDGLDLDWEYPENKTDMDNLAHLYKEWRHALEFEALVSAKLRLLLTSAVYYSSVFINYGLPRRYPARTMDKYLDWVGPMCYDYYGSWNKFTGPSAALYDHKSNMSTSYGLRTWIESGISPGKLVMALPLYGRTWMLRNPGQNEFGAPAFGPGPSDVGEGPGIWSYSNIVEFNEWSKGVVNYDGEIVAYYSYAGSTWAGYRHVGSVDLKIQFAKGLGLGGHFFWALGQDKDWTLSRSASNAWEER